MNEWTKGTTAAVAVKKKQKQPFQWIKCTYSCRLQNGLKLHTGKKKPGGDKRHTAINGYH